MASVKFDPLKARTYLSAETADKLADERAHEAIRMLLDGLGVESISELAVAVRAGRGIARAQRILETLKAAGR